MSRALRHVHALMSITVIIAMAIVCSGNVVWGGEATGAMHGARLETYTDASGQGYFALLLSDTHPSVADSLPALDVALLVDLSASQSGRRRQLTVDLAGNVIDQLTGGSRVQIWLTNRPRLPLLAKPSAVGSKKLAKAAGELANEAPSGTSHLAAALAAVEGWLIDRSGTLPKVVLAIGDGRDTGGGVEDFDTTQITQALVANRTVLHYVPIGGVIEANPMHALATATGGCITHCTDAVAESATQLVRSLAEPVLYVDRCTLGSAVQKVVPERLPPIRSDRATLLVGQWKPAARLRVRLEGTRSSKPVLETLDVAAVENPGGGAYLKDLFANWSKQPAMAAIGDGRQNLMLARTANELQVEQLLATAQNALARRQLPLAEELYALAQTSEPSNLEAADGLRAVQVARQSPDPRPAASREAPAKSPIKAVVPAEETFRPQDRTALRGVDEQVDPITDARTRMRVESQRLNRVVSRALSDASSQAKSDPEAAINLLKQVLNQVEASGIDANTIKTLERRLEGRLRTLFRVRAHAEGERLAQQRGFAQVENRRRELSQNLIRQQTAKQLMARYRTLMGDGRFSDAEQIAKSMQDDDTDSLVASGGRLQATLLQRYRSNEELEKARADGFHMTLAAAERSAIPMPDDVPVKFPAARWWEEMTIRRQKYKAVDLSPVTPKEEEIRRSLARPVSFDFDETPLTDVIEFLRDYTAVNIVIDKNALDEVAVSEDTPVTLELRDVSLKSALNLALRPLELTYAIRDEVLLITSQENATNTLLTKVYPVADLVLQIADFSNIGGGGGLGGGGLGGGAGLGGGGGGGGLGGIAGGGGGGGGGALGGGGGGGATGEDISEELIELIKRVIAPDTWDVSGGPGAIKAFPPKQGLVVRNRADVLGGAGKTVDAVRGDKDQSSKPKTPNQTAVAATDWDQHFSKHSEPASAIRNTVTVFASLGHHDQVVHMLNGYVRHRPARPWMYEAIALSMQLDGQPNDRIREAMMSLIDQAPDRLDVRLGVAEQLARSGELSSAVALLRATAKRFPGSVNTYYMLLELGSHADDLDAVAWAADQLLGREWARGGDRIHTRTRQQLDILEEQLRTNGRRGDADRMNAVKRQMQLRDLQITIRWAGEADIDLYVVEPDDVLCSPMTPRTVNGGVLVSDTISTSEKYVAAVAFSGKYELILRRVWGKPTAGTVTVDVVKHKGTPHEVRERHTVNVGASNEPITIQLDGGRRSQKTAISPDEVLVVGRLEERHKFSPLAQLRQLLGDGLEMPSEDDDGAIFGPGTGPLPQVGGGFASGGAVAFDPTITLLPDGVTLQAQAVVTADRRFVRLQMQPAIRTLEPLDQVRTIPIQGTAGGGGAVVVAP